MNCIIKRSAQILAVTALAFGLAACGKSEESKTPGQKLDSAISQTEKAAEMAGNKMQEGSAKAGDAVAEALAKAGEAAGAAVEKAGEKMSEKMSEGASMAGAALDDAGVTAAVKASLIKAPEISALQIDVDTKGGVVTLSGLVPSEAVKTQAGDIAKAAKGVTSVTNQLTVKMGG